MRARSFVAAAAVVFSVVLARADDRTPDTRTVAIETAPLRAAGAGSRLALPGLEAGAGVLVVDSATPRPRGVTLTGRVEGLADSHFALSLHAGQVSAGVWTAEGAFGLNPTGRLDAQGRAVCEAVALAPAAGPDCLAGVLEHDSHTPRSRAPGASGPGASRSTPCPDDPGFVDLMVVYTPLARAAAGGAAALQARVQNTIDSTNLALANSAVPDLEIHLAGFREIAYDESSPDWLDHLIRVTERSDGFMDEAHAWRDLDAADCVMLIVDDTRFTGGAAWWAVWDEAAAFSCLNWRSAGGGSLTGPHELGHNFGCAHDHDNDGAAPYSYSWGHWYTAGPDTYGTVMSYVGVTLPAFSNPTLTGPGGQPLGVPPGEPRAAFNALMISQARSVLANYRQSARVRDCDNNGVDDATDIAGGAPDENRNGIPDSCEARLFVDAEPHTEGDGLSWDDARRDLAEVLAVSNLSCALVREIWAADGSYRPDSGSDDPWARFSMRSGLALYGGFQGRSRPGGGETSTEERVPGAHPSVLTGDIGVAGDPADNSYAVLDAFDTDDTARLDGFTVRDGQSFGDGGGLYGVRTAIRLADCRFERNAAEGSGAGAMFYEASAPLLVRCEFADNTAGFVGGGLALNGSALSAHACAFTGNEAASYAGGLDAFQSDVTLANCVLWRNQAGIEGGGVSASGSDLDLRNCTLVQNHAAGRGGGLVTSGSALALRNTVLWENTGSGTTQQQQVFSYSGPLSLDYSVVQGLDGSLGGQGNLAADPTLADTDAGDLAPLPGSPCIDAASNPLAPADEADLDDDGDTAEPTPLDASGAPRFHDDPGTPDSGVPGNGHAAVADIGALEFQGNSCPADFNGDGRVNTIDVLQFLNAWSSRDPRADFNGDGNINTIDVLLFLNAWSAGC